MVSVGVGRGYEPPSSTFMLLVSVWTTQSWACPMRSSSSDPFDSSINGDRRKERYGVISDCATENANVSHIFYWTDDGMHASP